MSVTRGKATSLDRFKGAKPCVEIGSIDPWELRYSNPGKPDLVLRVVDMPGCQTISRALLGAFYEEAGNMLPLSRRRFAVDLRHFIYFLVDGKTPDKIEALDALLLKRYRSCLASDKTRSNAGRWKNVTIARTTQRKRYKCIERLVTCAARNHGNTVHPERNPLPGASKTGKANPHLSPIALIRILVAAKKEVRDVWKTFNDAQNIDEASPLGAAVRLAITDYGGLWPVNEARVSHKLRSLASSSGGSDAIARRLHSTVETIIPFVILLAYETVANAWALIEISNDCVVQDPLFETRSLISWDTKRRSRFSQSVSRDHRGEFSAPGLIAKLQALRKRLVPHVGALYRERLFLVRTKHSGVLPLSPDTAAKAVQEFLLRNDIREDDGTPVTFTLDMMRPSVLAEVYRRTQDLLVTFRLAGHVDIRTTVQYVIDRVTDELHDVAISDVQDALAKTIRGIEAAKQSEGSDGGPAWRRNENDCKDPYNGDGPFARKGQLCPTWFFPYNHPGLVVPNDVKYVTAIIRQKRQLEEMRAVWLPAKFEMVCQPALQIIVDDIIPNLDPDVVAESTERASRLPPLPVFPDV